MNNPLTNSTRSFRPPKPPPGYSHPVKGETVQDFWLMRGLFSVEWDMVPIMRIGQPVHQADRFALPDTDWSVGE